MSNPRSISFEFALVQYARPGGPVIPVGVLLLDQDHGQLWWRFVTEWASIVDEDDLEVIVGFSNEFGDWVRDLGAVALLERLEDTLSNVLRLTGRRTISGESPAATVDRLFETFVKGPSPCATQ